MNNSYRTTHPRVEIMYLKDLITEKSITRVTKIISSLLNLYFDLSSLLVKNMYTIVNNNIIAASPPRPMPSMATQKTKTQKLIQ